MAKRFTDTDIWKNQRWFKKLPPLYKLAFCYIKDCCNHAGLWKIDCSDLIDDLDIPDFNFQDFVASVNVEYDKISGQKITKERLKIVDGNVLWITGFIQFQYEGKDKKTNPSIAPVRTALVLLEGYYIPSVRVTYPLDNPPTLLDYALHHKHLTLTYPLLEGWQTRKEKDIDKDNIVKHKKSENEKNGTSTQFRSFSSQGEDLYANRLSKRLSQDDPANGANS